MPISELPWADGPIGSRRERGGVVLVGAVGVGSWCRTRKRWARFAICDVDRGLGSWSEAPCADKPPIMMLSVLGAIVCPAAAPTVRGQHRGDEPRPCWVAEAGKRRAPPMSEARPVRGVRPVRKLALDQKKEGRLGRASLEPGQDGGRKLNPSEASWQTAAAGTTSTRRGGGGRRRGWDASGHSRWEGGRGEGTRLACLRTGRGKG